jgi:hypothetical protein
MRARPSFGTAVDLPLTSEATAGELLAAAAAHFGGKKELTLHLDRDLIVSLDCVCGNSRRVMQPQQLVGAGEATCPACGQAAKPALEHSVDAGDALAGEQLSALGIPPYDIVRVGDDQKEAVFLLGGDRERIMG